VPDRYIRPVIAFVIFASGLKYSGLGTTALGWTLCGTLLVSGITWLLVARPWAQAAANPDLDGHVEIDDAADGKQVDERAFSDA
jgi:hypothetical protein